MIKAFLIDLFDTLVYFEEKRYHSWRQEMAAFMGIPHDEFMKVWWKYTPERFLGKIRDIPHMLTVMAEHFRVELREQEIEELSRKEAEVLLSISHLYPGTLESLKAMKEGGFLTALVSNASSNAIYILDHLGLSPLFDTMVISCDVGVAKPDEKIYRIALERLGVSPGESLFIGDGASNELDGAQKAGIHAAKINQDHQTKNFGKSDHYDFEITHLAEAIEIAAKL